MTKGAPFLSNLWQFLYPHTIIGTVLSILVNSQIALSQASAPRDDAALRAVGVALAAALCMNGYIVGINQCFDVAIDRVNKPYLPLASGAWSLAFGQKLVALEGLAALAIAAFAPGATPALLRTVGVSGLLGTAYSVDMPGLRWKQHPLLASICILSVRGFVVQAGFYQHMVQALDLPTDYAASPVIRLSITFVTILSVAIAFCKDVPDIAGDAKAGVRTLPVRLGARRVLRLVYALMLLCYVVAIAASWRSASATLAHAALAALTVVRAAGTDPDSVGSVRSFYMHVWTCFYLEYLVLLAVAPADVVMPATLADAGSWLGGEAGAALLAVWRTVPYLVPLAVAALAYAKKW
jgi:homogentisate phytyltransferase/homogentisate geranylgeranyltransferase